MFLPLPRPQFRWSSATERCSLLCRRLLADDDAQDLIEYALLAGFLAVIAGAALPDINEGIEKIFDSMKELLGKAAGPTKCCD